MGGPIQGPGCASPAAKLVNAAMAASWDSGAIVSSMWRPTKVAGGTPSRCSTWGPAQATRPSEPTTTNGLTLDLTIASNISGDPMATGTRWVPGRHPRDPPLRAVSWVSLSVVFWG
jgi:hypothetical protein